MAAANQKRPNLMAWRPKASADEH